METSRCKLRWGRSDEHFFVMTVDVDGWSSLLSFYYVKCDPEKADRLVSVESGISRLLELFEEHEMKATFFVTGQMAQKHSRILKEIHNEGHEIACHGFFHRKSEFLLGEDVQTRIIEKATRTIGESIGLKPKGFRAPCLRMNETTLRVLERLRYLYDSSIVPTFVPGYYGSPSAPLAPYHPSTSDMNRAGSLNILEIPVSVNPLLPLPLSAAWLRNLGSSWVKLGLRANFAVGNPVVLYVHPRDVLCLPRVRGVPWHIYRNVGDSMVQMLDDVFKHANRCGAEFVRAIDMVRYLLACK